MADTEFAPAAIRAVYDRLVLLRPDWKLALGGILGDAAHTYGYHRARAVLPPDDYSVVLPRDRKGRDWAASALDVTPEDQLVQRAITANLLRAAVKRDRRVFPVLREFFGSVDGREVTGWDLHTQSESTSDASHLWHVHLSFHRKFACRRAMLSPVADVMAGR